MDFFSLLIIQDLTSAHSGDYTCRATNDFGTVSHSASLIVKGIYCLRLRANGPLTTVTGDKLLIWFLTRFVWDCRIRVASGRDTPLVAATRYFDTPTVSVRDRRWRPGKAIKNNASRCTLGGAKDNVRLPENPTCCLLPIAKNAVSLLNGSRGPGRQLALFGSFNTPTLQLSAKCPTQKTSLWSST